MANIIYFESDRKEEGNAVNVNDGEIDKYAYLGSFIDKIEKNENYRSFVYILLYNKFDPRNSKLATIPYNINNDFREDFIFRIYDETNKLIEEDIKDEDESNIPVMLEAALEENKTDKIDFISSLSNYLSDERCFYSVIVEINNDKVELVKIPNNSYFYEKVFNTIAELTEKLAVDMDAEKKEVTKNLISKIEEEKFDLIRYVLELFSSIDTFFVYVIFENEESKENRCVLSASSNIQNPEIFYSSLFFSFYEDLKKDKSVFYGDNGIFFGLTAQHTYWDIDSNYDFVNTLIYYLNKYKYVIFSIAYIKDEKLTIDFCSSSKFGSRIENFMDDFENKTQEYFKIISS